ncbi:hypothetical protein [Thiomonas sp.]|jgi:hypothetical protein|uniref:hypothetical protein n=1 Tax=Thiomonas sp. TaxID=2047785 RepID=UPI0026294F95|nr:hypothetical protein [Thiomonas sp.]
MDRLGHQRDFFAIPHIFLQKFCIMRGIKPVVFNFCRRLSHLAARRVTPHPGPVDSGSLNHRNHPLQV